MASRVVCIARSRGAGGEAVGRMVSNGMRFRYVDDEILVRASEKADVDPSLVADAEHRKGLMARILDVMAQAGATETEPSAFAPDAIMAANASTNYQDLIREVIRECGTEGSAVIVAHAAGMALTEMNDVLRVLITASPETRAARLVEAGGLSEGDARKEIDNSDKERADYFLRFYEIREELPTHYDLVVNTDHLSLQRAAQVVIGAAQA